MDNIMIEIAIGLDDELPTHQGYYYDFDDAIEELFKLKEKYSTEEGIKNESCN